ncbi:S-layer homology domain-containing protein, partial [Sedimentibacter saalensis]|uniref:S-layer homology domain-containing protein n=1 Tax=Sedimentibacter saalensis TaxID=130788 RepID=UPI00119EF3FC
DTYENSYPGWTYVSGAVDGLTSAVVEAPNGTTKLKLYYTVDSVDFTVEHYLQNSDGTTYPATPTYTETDSANTGVTVYDDTYENSYPGWTYVSGAVDGVTSAVVEVPNGTTILKLYYELRTDLSYTINYYKDNVTNTDDVNFLETESVYNVTFLSGITLTEEQLNKHQPTGYHSGVQQGTVPYVIQVSGNVINVLYSRITIEIPVNKVWIGEVPYESNGVVVNLMSGEQLIDSLTLNEPEWTDSFVVPKYDDQGNEIQYTVEEVEIDGYISKVIKNENGSYTITNTETVDIFVQKYWIDEVYEPTQEMSIMQDKVTRPNIIINLWVGEAIITSVTLENGDTEHVFENLPKFDSNGVPINYGVDEVKVVGYDTFVHEYEDDYYVLIENIIQNHDVFYNANFTTTDTMTDNLNPYKYGEKVTVLGNTFTRYNYTFIGWNTESNGSGTSYYPGNVERNTFDMPANDVTLYAQWSYNGDDDDDDDDEDIPDPQVPLADLEKLDHFAYVIGYPEGDVRPLNNITREEVAMIFYRLLTDESRNNLLSDSNPFTDLENHGWSNRAISTLYNAGIIKGYPDGTFKPSDPISRAEFATIAAKFDKLELGSTSKFTDIFGHWAEKYITSSEIKGWIKGYPDLTFKPEQDITRAEAMTLINNVLERLVPEENIHPDAMFWPDSTSDKWYFEAVMEATNSHNYIYEEDGDELWTGLKANKVWP